MSSSKKIAESKRPVIETEADKCVQIAKTIPKEYGTFKQRKMLAVMLLPNSYNWSVTDKCLVADMARSEWYRHINNPQFGEKCVKVTQRIKGRDTVDIFKAFVKNAIEGGKEGYGNSSSQLAYLQDVGVMSKPEKSNANINVTIIQQQREEKLERGLNRFGLTRAGNN